MITEYGIGDRFYCWTFDFMDLASSFYKDDIHIIKQSEIGMGVLVVYLPSEEDKQLTILFGMMSKRYFKQISKI